MRNAPDRGKWELPPTDTSTPTARGIATATLAATIIGSQTHGTTAITDGRHGRRQGVEAPNSKKGNKDNNNKEREKKKKQHNKHLRLKWQLSMLATEMCLDGWR